MSRCLISVEGESGPSQPSSCFRPQTAITTGWLRLDCVPSLTVGLDTSQSLQNEKQLESRAGVGLAAIDAAARYVAVSTV